MAWLGKVSLGGFPDLAGAVNKLSESVKNIEKNFDSALGFEEKSETNEASGIWPSAVDRKALFDPVMAFMGNRGDESRNRGDGSNPESPEKVESMERPSSEEKQDDLPSEVSVVYTAETELGSEKASMIFGTMRRSDAESLSSSSSSSLILGPDKDKIECQSNVLHAEEGSTDLKIEGLSSSEQKQSHENVLNSTDGSQEGEKVSKISPDIGQDNIIIFPALDSSHDVDNSQNIHDKLVIEENIDHIGSPKHLDRLDNGQLMPERESPGSSSLHISKAKDLRDFPDVSFSSLHSSPQYPAIQDFSTSNELIERGSPMKSSDDVNEKVDRNMMTGLSDFTNILTELENVKKEREMMQSALQGAARQAQAKADEIAKLMNENEQLKSTVEELKRNTTEADIDALRDEFHQRVANLERKVYALTKERDTLRREQNKRNDAAALLKEKDEIITQIMAEGEGLSKKQAAQESTIRKLRAQIREMEEEKQRISSKLQVEETKSESIRKDKLATEKLLQETIEKYQADISSQKEFYNSELKLAKEAEALAELRANSEAQIELECRLKESGERESMLVQTLEELRQALTRTEQQAATKEEMLRQEIDEIQKRYQASELRYSELITQVPDSKRPLLRQIEAMQETASRREEAWRDVERSLNFRVQEAEAKAAAADERERSMSEQLSQSLSRITVLETQITFLRTEHGQFSRTLEKERQRSAENRQEYLIAKEEALTQEGRANQFEDEIKELKSRHKKELEEEIAHRELVEKELERERTTRIELEKTASRQTSVVVDQNYSPDLKTTYADNGIHLPRRLSSARSMNNMDESAFLQASLDSSGCPFSERKAFGETLSPYALKSMTPSAFEAALRQKDGELASYISRLASMEMARDSLTEELFKLTRESEKLRGEASLLPGIKAELDALRRRHNAALELMGERDEELEELRADIIDLKEMYREQIDLLVNRIQKMTPQAGAQ